MYNPWAQAATGSGEGASPGATARAPVTVFFLLMHSFLAAGFCACGRSGKGAAGSIEDNGEGCTPRAMEVSNSFISSQVAGEQGGGLFLQVGPPLQDE